MTADRMSCHNKPVNNLHSFSVREEGQMLMRTMPSLIKSTTFFKQQTESAGGRANFS